MYEWLLLFQGEVSEEDMRWHWTGSQLVVAAMARGNSLNRGKESLIPPRYQELVQVEPIRVSFVSFDDNEEPCSWANPLDMYIGLVFT